MFLVLSLSPSFNVLSFLFPTGICFLAYFGASSVLTLMCPYASIPERGAFAKVFEMKGASWAKYVVGIGALCGLLTSILGSMVPLPRMMYAMASDGLIFK